MNNYLNFKSIFSILILILVLSCNKDDSDSSSEETDTKYLISITSNEGDPTYPKYKGKDTLVYENDKIVKAFIGAGCTPFIYQYVYGTNGKIAKIYEIPLNIGGGFPSMEELIEMFENSTVIENSIDHYRLEYDSENRLINIQNSFDIILFEYDNKGRLYKKIYPNDNLTITIYEFDENNNPLLITSNYGGTLSDRVYTYGSLNNPYYTLFQKYGLLEIDCALVQDFISPNVVTSSGNINYSYYSDGNYPSSVREIYNGNTSIYDFIYR